MYHTAMREIPWATPEALGRLTIPQLACLGSEKPPGNTSGSAEAFQEYLRRRAAEEAAWAAGIDPRKHRGDVG